jgi:bud site selection protein 31
MGCASGKGAGPRNIFGNKYGQNLAAVQIAREKRIEAKQKQAEEERQRREQEEERRHAASQDGAG